MMFLTRLTTVLKTLKGELLTLYYAFRDPRTPIRVKILTILVIAYAFSPIDLISDLIPFLGLLDDLLLIPLGISFTMKLIPEDVLKDCQEKAGVLPSEEQPKKSYIRTLKMLVWIVILAVISFILYTQIR